MVRHQLHCSGTRQSTGGRNAGRILVPGHSNGRGRRSDSAPEGHRAGDRPRARALPGPVRLLSRRGWCGRPGGQPRASGAASRVHRRDAVSRRQPRHPGDGHAWQRDERARSLAGGRLRAQPGTPPPRTAAGRRGPRRGGLQGPGVCRVSYGRRPGRAPRGRILRTSVPARVPRFSERRSPTRRRTFPRDSCRCVP